MAVEQSRTSGNDMRTHSAKGSHGVGRTKAAGFEGGVPGEGGFAAVLATTDMGEEPSVDVCTAASSCEAVAPMAVAVEGQRPDGGARAAVPAQKERLPFDTAPDSTSSMASGSRAPLPVDATDADRGTQTGATTTGLGPAATLLQGLLSLQAEGLQPGASGEVGAEGPPLPVAGAGGGRGFMKTSQLQQNLSVLAGKGVATPARATVSVDAAMALQVQDSAAAASSSVAGMHAMLVERSSAGGHERGAEMGFTAMSPMAFMASQPDRAGREWRGQDELRGVGATVLDSWGGEATELVEQGGSGAVVEEPPMQETVRYWLGADSKQQAELTVQDVGGGSVDVTIHMHGKETQVSFRADQQQARDALQSASGHLEQLLGREGLTLSGLSVETSSAGQDGRREPRQGGGKTAKVTGIEAPPAQTSAGPTLASSGFSPGRGNKLDLFV